jgi:uncharacterized protein DUF4159
MFFLTLTSLSASLLAPRADLGSGRPSASAAEFQFARVQFNSFGRYGWMPGWAHDYPKADRNFMTILAEVTHIRTTPNSYVIVRLDDPALMNFPLLYFSEPGTWDITEAEAKNFRDYLSRGGFAIFDDFDGYRQWSNFERCMRQVLPVCSFQRLTVDHPVFQCVYEIHTLDMVPPYDVGEKPVFYGLFDSKGRLNVVANFNNDIGDYWEWSGEALYPISMSNEGYKVGVNYVMYALTH